MARDRGIQYPWALHTGQPIQWAGQIESQEVKKSVLISNFLLTGVRNPTSGGAQGGGTTDIWRDSFHATPIASMLKSRIQ